MRNEFITAADVRRIQKDIEAETIRLDDRDGQSVLNWVENLRSRGELLGFKSSSDAPPPGSGLATDAFALCIQTAYQHECWTKFGNNFAGIDATHNTTHYEGMGLYTVITRDKWGHGMPVAWMISSNAKEATVDYFLEQLRKANPKVSPKVFMSDKDYAQLNAIERRYPKSRRLLCWWHVLHAWQQHFVTTHHPELWELMKGWIRITDQAEFDSCWTKIQALAPESVIDYLETYWLKEPQLWSALYRKDRGIFYLGDTNMLVEVYVNYSCLSTDRELTLDRF